MMEDAALQEALNDYLINHLLPGQGVTIKDCRLTAPPTGAKTGVQLLEFPDGKCIVLRIFPRRKKKRIQQLLLADKLLRQNKVPASPIIDCYECKHKGGYILVAEEMLTGKTLHNMQFSQELIAKLAELVATLHKIKDPAWGLLKKPGRGSFFKGLLRRVKHRLHSLGKYGRGAIMPQELAPIWRWFQSWEDQFLPMTLFELIHGDPNRGNFIYSTAADKLFMIDFSTLQFGYRAKDLIHIYHEVFERNKALVEQFEEAYFEFFTPAEERLFRQLRPLFHVYYHLSQSAIQNKRDYKVKKYQPGREATFNLKFQYHWEEVNRLIGLHKVPTGG